MEDNKLMSKKDKAYLAFASSRGFKNNSDFIKKIGPKEWKRQFNEFYKDFEKELSENLKLKVAEVKENDKKQRVLGSDEIYLKRLKEALIYLSENPKVGLSILKSKFILLPEMLQYMRMKKMIVNFGTNPFPRWELNTSVDDENLSLVIKNSRNSELMKALKNKRKSKEFDKYLIKKRLKK